MFYLSSLIFLPLLGGIALLFLPKDRGPLIRWAALGVAAIELILSLVLALLYVESTISIFSSSQFRENITWISSLGINYSLDIDGVSLLLVVLTTLLTAICIAASFGNERKVKNYMAFMLLFESGMLGVFLSSNLFLFYIFWEVMLIPAYFLLGSWGGPRRIYAAFKFVIYTSVGSFLMLAGIIALGYYHQQATGSYTLDINALLTTAKTLDPTVQIWLFLAFAAAFAVKVPFVPFHSWLPDAYSEAPAAVTALLAGAMSKTGAYGFLRLCIPLFPQAAQTLAPVFSILALVGILYCALMALVQTDLKRLLGYSSISHLGVVMLGMFSFTSQGVEGSVLQMVNHGITIAALFLLVGYLEQRTGTRRINEFGGLASRAPWLATVMLIAALSSLGLPGLNSFAGEFITLLGVFRTNIAYGVLGTIVVVPAAWYMLRFFLTIMSGPRQTEGVVGNSLRKGTFKDISFGEFWTVAPLLALIFVFGVLPAPLIWVLEQSVPNLLATLGNAFIR
ncbi:complex I subunit 4 family protein [Tengunoibacter tsumagoiensis]|uniref:NADH:ubiquinone oxidoreductase subunit M n=1 Tax=Tengunoibacter tsumagoiensis TaxID=2014871 RepID=A0A401ZVC1_9CHLR|nr:NADH-quinone oxidoreductase subunit M [Tengunoibacter tsumagoiensis]GCE10736.1 NADH:ubiquinone oxidoreductase subunit M [Tengunoibacter tsumagoiensis]